MKERNDSEIRSKIETLETVPSSSFDKTAAWEKLERRLEPGKKKMINWRPYGIAAGILLLITAGLLIFNREKTEPVIISKVQPPIIVEQPTTPVKKEEPVVVVKQPANTARKILPVANKVQTPILPATENIYVQEEPIRSIAVVPDKVEVAVSIATPAVVHINELMDEPVAEKPKPKQERFIDKVYASSQKVNPSKTSISNNSAGNRGLLNLGFNKEN